MGCDIHATVERQLLDGYWVLAARDIPIDRQYSLFTTLAGVRNYYTNDKGESFEAISQPRGLPEGATDEFNAEVEDWDGNGHSHSWVTLAELKKVKNKVFEELSFYKYMLSLQKEHNLKDDQIRLVFFFDN